MGSSKGKNNTLRVAVDAAMAAGKLLMASYGKLKNSQIGMKAKNDFVTEVDKKSEKLVISIIKKHFPAHAIQAEESGVSGGKELLWIIDPLDGTSNYIHHIPIFAVSIGVLENNVPVAGVVFDPIHRELFTARKGGGAFLNGRRFQVSKTTRLSKAFMATGIPFRARDRFHEYITSFKRISLASVGLRRGGSAALDLAYVACGRFDGFWEIDLSPWDIAAGALMIEEAGGRITDMWAKNEYFKNGDVLASNALIHKELAAITSGAFTTVDKDKRCLLS